MNRACLRGVRLISYIAGIPGHYHAVTNQYYLCCCPVYLLICVVCVCVCVCVCIYVCVYMCIHTHTNDILPHDQACVKWALDKSLHSIDSAALFAHPMTTYSVKLFRILHYNSNIIYWEVIALDQIPCFGNVVALAFLALALTAVLKQRTVVNCIKGLMSVPFLLV